MKEICIIKLGADGDVLRTLPLAKAIRNKNKDSRITWITKGDIKSLIDNLDYIDYVEIYHIQQRKFLMNYITLTLNLPHLTWLS